MKVGEKRVELSGLSLDADGVSVRDRGVTVEASLKRGLGVSTPMFGDTLGVHFKDHDGAAVLGAVSVTAGGEEVSVGLVPAAPSPLPMPVYSGKERK